MAPYIPLLLFLALPFPTGSPQTARSNAPERPAWDAPRPRPAWKVEASIGRNGDEWRLDLWKSHFSVFSFTLDPASVRLTVKDHRDRTVPVKVFRVEPATLVRRRNAQFPGEQSYRIVWNVAALKSDMYTVAATLSVRATDGATGEPVALPPVHSTVSRFYKTPEPDAAPALKPGQRFLFVPRYEATPDDLEHMAEDELKRKAARTISDERLFAINVLFKLELAVPEALTSDKSDRLITPGFQPQYRMPYVDARAGAPVRMRDVVLKVFTLTAVRPAAMGDRTLEFAVGGRQGLVRVEASGDVLHLPHLTPLVEDANLRALRTKFEGKAVWFNGGCGFECVTLTPRESGSFDTDASMPMPFKRIVRLYQPNETLAIGGAPGYMGPRDSEFTFDNPIVAIVDVPAKAALGAGAWSGFALGDDEKNMPYVGSDLKKLCAGTTTTFADAWDMERLCRLDDPRTVARKWPGRFRTAVSKCELRKGMTPDMVVAAIGWPNEYATPAEMRKWAEWRYDNGPTINYWVTFRNGRVISWGPDGRLP